MDAKLQKKIKIIQSQEIIDWYNKLTKEEQEAWDWIVGLSEEERKIFKDITELDLEIRTTAMWFFKGLVRWRWAGKTFIYVLGGTVVLITSFMTVYNSVIKPIVERLFP